MGSKLLWVLTMSLAASAQTRPSLMEDSGKELWERRTAVEWQQLAGEFGFTEVMTFEGWDLHLPEIARSHGLVLYAVPAAHSSAHEQRVAESPDAAEHRLR